jgi:death-on-curing protein
LREAVVLAIHEAQLAEHGGPAGVRDASLTESALARPRQLQAYGQPAPDIAALAAAYGYGLARNPPFVDGNKRTALVVMETFLALNHWQLDASNVECVQQILMLAGGELDEAALADWLRPRLRPLAKIG